MSSIKTLREKLCAAQVGSDWPPDVKMLVTTLIDRIDLHRPIGPDGKHGSMHTRTCGCEDGQLVGGPVSELTEEEKSRTTGPVADLDWRLFSKHQHQASRKWPDGTEPSAPNWNPGCSCGASHYYFEHSRHLAEVVHKSEWLDAVKVAARKEAMLKYAEVADGCLSPAGSWQDVASDVRGWVEGT